MPLGNGERYYSSGLGRFIQQDSFTGYLDETASLNRYSYVHNNPTRFTDPSGHEVQEGLVNESKHDAAIAQAERMIDSVPGVPVGVGLDLRYLTGVSASIGIGLWSKAYQVDRRNQMMIRGGANPANLPDPFTTALFDSTPVVGGALRAGFGIDPIEGRELSFDERMSEGAWAVLELELMVVEDLALARLAKGARVARLSQEVLAKTGTTGVRTTRKVLQEGTEEVVERTYRPGEVLPDGTIAGRGPGAAVYNDPDFYLPEMPIGPERQLKAAPERSQLVGEIDEIAGGGKPRTLNYGAGNNPMSGATNVDPRIDLLHVPGYDIVRIDPERLPFLDATFDEAVSLNAYGYNPLEVSELRRVLKSVFH
jgi:hypothetical protein